MCTLWLVGAVLTGVGVVYAKPTCGDTVLIPRREGDVKALNAIIQAIPGSKTHIAKPAKTARDAWENLRGEYHSVNAMWATRLKTNILGYKFLNGYRMTSWQDDMQRMYQELHNINDKALSNNEFAHHLVTMMPTNDHWRYLHSELSSKVRGAAPGLLRLSEILRKLRDKDKGI